MISLNPNRFKIQFQKLIDTNVSDEELDSIDDEIRVALDGRHADDAALCAQLAVEILTKSTRPWPLAYALNTHIGVCCSTGDIKSARLALEQLVELTIEHNTYQAALSAAENVRNLLPGNTTPDQVPHILKLIVQLYEHLQLIDKAVETLIIAAHLLSDYGAFQTAYRSLADAEKLARDHSLPESYVNVLVSMHGVCILEGDHKYADQVWQTLNETCEKLSRPTPKTAVLNRATALMQIGEYRLAKDGFEHALNSAGPRDQDLFAILINQSACLREIGDQIGSEECMVKARYEIAKLDYIHLDKEQLLELELIAAKNAVKSNQMIELAACLNRASTHLDSAIQLVDKLHYRRGLRDRYIRRMENLLTELPILGSSSDIVNVIACTRSNRLTDWLHLLSWAKDVSAKVTEDEKKHLDDVVFKLANHGAPHLYGYREKYDDPMAYSQIPDPWRGFAEFASNLCDQYNFRKPFENSIKLNVVSLLNQRLNEGFGIYINLLTAGGKALLLIGQRYIICDLPEAETRDFHLSLTAHRNEPNQSKQLDASLKLYQSVLSTCLRPILNELSDNQCKGLIFIPDQMDLTPINLVLIGDPAIQSKMIAGQFEVRTCLALYPMHEFSGKLETCLGVIEAESDLRCDKAELEGFYQITNTTATTLVNPEWGAFAELMSSSDALILAQHGMSIGLFRDPHFGNLAGPHKASVIWFDKVQQEAYQWHHKLVILGSCHSGGLINRNYQNKFQSHDLTGFPSAFLVNGQCVVLASGWAIIDRFNILLSMLFAQELNKLPITAAFSSALAKLHMMRIQDLDVLIKLTNSYMEEFTDSLTTIDNLRKQPFCYGAYQLYTLL